MEKSLCTDNIICIL